MFTKDRYYDPKELVGFVTIPLNFTIESLNAYLDKYNAPLDSLFSSCRNLPQIRADRRKLRNQIYTARFFQAQVAEGLQARVSIRANLTASLRPLQQIFSQVCITRL